MEVRVRQVGNFGNVSRGDLIVSNAIALQCSPYSPVAHMKLLCHGVNLSERSIRGRSMYC